MRIFVFNLREYDEKQYFDHFCNVYGDGYAYTGEYPSLENADIAKGCEAISIIPCDMNAQLLDQFQKIGVKYVATRSIGVDHIDVAHAHSIGLKISNVSYSPNSVANYAIMLMLMSCRKMLPIHEGAKHQDYRLKGKMGRELSQCTVGIIGTGEIGRTVLKHLSGFGCRLLAYAEHQNSETEHYAQYVDLDTMFQTCDIISLHTNLTPKKHHMINKDSIARMKNGVILINTARSGLMDTDALMEGIECGKIGAAALDVLEREQEFVNQDKRGELSSDRNLAILNSYPNVIVTPHMAFYTDQAVSDQIESTFISFAHFKAGTNNPFEIK